MMTGSMTAADHAVDGSSTSISILHRRLVKRLIKRLVAMRVKISWKVSTQSRSREQTKRVLYFITNVRHIHGIHFHSSKSLSNIYTSQTQFTRPLRQYLPPDSDKMPLRLVTKFLDPSLLDGKSYRPKHNQTNIDPEVQRIIQIAALLGQILPTEIVPMILDHAEYWYTFQSIRPALSRVEYVFEADSPLLCGRLIIPPYVLSGSIRSRYSQPQR